MKWLDKLFDKFVPGLEFHEVPARNNWHGVPKPDLTWNEVSKKTQEICPIIPMTFEIYPECCPVCGGELKKYKSDWANIEGDSGLYMVKGLYCPNGHWTHLRWV